MNSIFEKNVEAFKTHHPELFKKLESALITFRSNSHQYGDDSFQPFKNSDGTSNIIYSNAATRNKFPVHQQDPIDEAHTIFKQVNLDHPHIVFFFGLGMGHTLAEFMKLRSKTNFAVMVIERKPFFFFHALTNYDFTKWFDDKSISWAIGFEEKELHGKLDPFFQAFTTVSRHLKIIPLNNIVAADQKYYETAATDILGLRDYTTVLGGNSVPDTFRGFEHTLKNLDLIIKNPGMFPLQDKFRGKTCISVAAGPSVNQHWDFLKRVQGRVPIIACDTLVKPMIDRGVVPDFVTAIERDPIVTGFFIDQPVSQRSVLVAPTLILRESFMAYQGPHMIYAPSPNYVEYLNLLFISRMHGGASAGNLNLNLATFMGFSNIIMIGHNLAYGYKTNETHAAGTVDKDRERSRTEEELKKEASGGEIISQDGEVMLPTRTEWNIFRVQIETVVDMFKGKINFINTSAKGARIAGTILMSAEEAYRKYVTEEFDIYPQRLALVKAPSDEEMEARRALVLKGVNVGLETLNKWHAKGEEVVKKLKKWKTKIEEAEIQGKHVSMEFLNNSLSEVLSLKVAAVNEDQRFYQVGISVLFPFHLVFERELNAMPGSYKDNYSLKKDFLLKHLRYFEQWSHWFPQMIEKLEWAKKEHLENIEYTQSQSNG